LSRPEKESIVSSIQVKQEAKQSRQAMLSYCTLSSEKSDSITMLWAPTFNHEANPEVGT
jgi:hypothetical protein